MNKRRLSFGLLVTLAAFAVVGCGDSTPAAETPPQPSAAATAEAAPPATAAAEAPAPPPKEEAPAPPPAKPAKDKWAGSWAQDFSGDVMNIADAAAKKAAGKADKDGKKYDAAMDKAKAAVSGNTLDTTLTDITWNVGGKAKHKLTFEVVSGDKPDSIVVKLTGDNKKPIKKPVELSVSFTADDTIAFDDPFPAKPGQAMKLVFKKK